MRFYGIKYFQSCIILCFSNGLFKQGIVGDDSCYEYASCYERSSFGSYSLKFNVGDFSCRGQNSCLAASEWIILWIPGY